MERGLSRMTGEIPQTIKLKKWLWRAQCGESRTLRSVEGSCCPNG